MKLIKLIIKMIKEMKVKIKDIPISNSLLLSLENEFNKFQIKIEKQLNNNR